MSPSPLPSMVKKRACAGAEIPIESRPTSRANRRIAKPWLVAIRDILPSPSACTVLVLAVALITAGLEECNFNALSKLF